MGDPAGIGPEIIAGAWRNAEVHQQCRPVVIGHAEVMRRAVRLLGEKIDIIEIGSPNEALPSPTALPCIRATRDDAAQVPPAVIDPRGGQAAFDALQAAADLALSQQVDGIVTAPLNKAALHAAGHPYPGHTELLATMCGVDESAMMLYLPPEKTVGKAGLSVVHVTLHMAMRDVFDHITTERIVSRTRMLDSACRALAPEKLDRPPLLAVCALNPHAGEKGLFGDEEETIIRPAVEQLKGEGMDVVGPLPADTLMHQAAAGAFDGVVAMVHDQGHIAVKLLDMYHAVNVTLGLPIIRTSVAHGTAFDLAWQGRAKTRSMISAIETGARLCR